MRRVLTLFCLLFSSLFFLSSPALAGAASLGITGGGNKVIGATVNMSATLNPGGNKICVVSFNITYPADLLELKSNSLGSPYSMTTEQSSSAGNIHYQIGAIGCPTDNATILNMTFKTKAAGSATVAISPIETMGGEEGKQSIEVSGGSAVIKIAAVAKNTTAPAVTPAVVVKDPVLVSLSYTTDVQLDSVGFKAKGIIFSGTADPEAKINITIASDPITASTTADASGNWTYTLSDWLEAGPHKITLVAEKSNVKSNEVVSDFIIGTAGKNQIAIGTTLPEIPATVSAPASSTKTESKLSTRTIAIIAGGSVLLLILVLLTVFLIKRRHYLQVANEISGSMQQSPSGSATQGDGQFNIPSNDDLSQSLLPEDIQPELQQQNVGTMPGGAMGETAAPVQVATSSQGAVAVPKPESKPVNQGVPALDNVVDVRPDNSETVVGYGLTPSNGNVVGDSSPDVQTPPSTPAAQAEAPGQDVNITPGSANADQGITYDNSK